MRLLFFISQNYSFEILRPVQKLARSKGYDVKWMVYLDRVNLALFNNDEDFTTSAQEAVAFNPDAVLVPGNQVPGFLPGLKVEVFHGFEWKKKGHFRIRGGFDLYCTQGPFFTDRFEKLAEEFQYFDVQETGWPKLDPLFSAKAMARDNLDKPCVLYAPTFSPSLTSVPDLYEQIVKLSKNGNWHWLVKFHPKMESSWVEKFKAAQHDHLQVVETAEIAPVLQTADVILSDTSSIITEFMLLNRPAVTYKNKQPDVALIDFTDASLLEQKLTEALEPTEDRLKQIRDYNEQFHPYQDGQSANRILTAIEDKVANGKKAPKALPVNLIRNLKMRKKLKYWKF